MKKFLAVITIILLTFALSSCAPVLYEEDLDIVSQKEDTQSAIYTALNINVVAYRVNDRYGNVVTEFVIEVGVKEELYDIANLESNVSAFFRECGQGCDRLTYYTADSEGQTYKFYCAVLLVDGNCLSYNDELDYGFFFITQHYTVTAPAWIDNLYQGIRQKIQNSFDLSSQSGSRYLIDEDATRVRYFYYEDAPLKSKDAKNVYKRFMAQNEEYYEFLMWEATNDDYSFQNITLDYRVPVSGFYIVPILIGGIVVVILLIVVRRKRIDPEQEIIVEESTSPILEGQISMEDFGLVSVVETKDNEDNTEEHDG